MKKTIIPPKPPHCRSIAARFLWRGLARTGVFELLDDVDAATAAAKPLANVHSIWELVLHIAAWDSAAMVRLAGEKYQPTGLRQFSSA